MDRDDIKRRIETLQKLDFRKTIHGETLAALKGEYIACNIIDLNPEANIYRIFSFDRLLETLNERKLTLVKPRRWEDPFENFLLKATGIMSDGQRVSFESIREAFYAQCWSLREECDGLWRTFGAGAVAVKVKSSIKKLFDSFYDIGNPFHTLSYFIGQVEYVDDSAIRNVFSRKIDYFFSSDNILLVHTLLVKRAAFNYEREVRLIFDLPNNDEADYSRVKNMWDKNSDFFSFEIDVNSVIEEIAFDPHVPKADFENMAIQINSLGYQGSIKRSDLYDEPSFTARIF